MASGKATMASWLLDSAAGTVSVWAQTRPGSARTGAANKMLRAKRGSDPGYPGFGCRVRDIPGFLPRSWATRTPSMRRENLGPLGSAVDPG